MPHTASIAQVKGHDGPVHITAPRCELHVEGIAQRVGHRRSQHVHIQGALIGVAVVLQVLRRTEALL